MWDGATYWVSATFAADCGAGIKLRLHCSGGGDCGAFILEASCDNGGSWFPTAQQIGCTCTPLALAYATTLVQPACGTCNPYDLIVTITR